MQRKNEKSLLLAKTIGEIIKGLRLKCKKATLNKFAHEFDLDVGNTSRIENSLIDVKLVTLWKISEALNLPLSEIIKTAESKLPNDFHFFDE